MLCASTGLMHLMLSHAIRTQYKASSPICRSLLLCGHITSVRSRGIGRHLKRSDLCSAALLVENRPGFVFEGLDKTRLWCLIVSLLRAGYSVALLVQNQSVLANEDLDRT